MCGRGTFSPTVRVCVCRSDLRFACSFSSTPPSKTCETPARFVCSYIHKQPVPLAPPPSCVYTNQLLDHTGWWADQDPLPYTAHRTCPLGLNMWWESAKPLTLSWNRAWIVCKENEPDRTSARVTDIYIMERQGRYSRGCRSGPGLALFSRHVTGQRGKGPQLSSLIIQLCVFPCEPACCVVYSISSHGFTSILVNSLSPRIKVISNLVWDRTNGVSSS